MDNSLKALVAIFCIVLSLGSTAQLALESEPANLVVDSGAKNDIDAPRTDLLNSHVGDFIFGPATRMKFKIIEEGSGLETTYFKISNLPYMKSDGRQMMPHDLEDGAYEMLYYSIDKAGNQEPVRRDNIYIDKQGPEVTSSFSTTAESFEDGMPIFPQDVQLLIEVADKKVDVQKVTYSINEGPKVESGDLNTIDLTKELVSIEDEIIKIEVTAYDSFYNISKEVIAFRIER